MLVLWNSFGFILLKYSVKFSSNMPIHSDCSLYNLRAILTALFSRRFLVFPVSVKTACASLNLRPHLLLLSIKSACGGRRVLKILFCAVNTNLQGV